MSKPITRESFEMDDYCSDLSIQRVNQDGVTDEGKAAGFKAHWHMDQFTDKLIESLEDMRQEYIRLADLEGCEEEQYQVWKELVRWLPEAWLQTRTVTMTYENLLAMCSKSQRRPHKLNEWSGRRNPELENFIKWARTLPYAQEFIFFDELVSPGEMCAKSLREVSAKLNFGPTFNHYGITIAYEDGRIKPINILMSELADVLDKNEKI